MEITQLEYFFVFCANIYPMFSFLFYSLQYFCQTPLSTFANLHTLLYSHKNESQYQKLFRKKALFKALFSNTFAGDFLLFSRLPESPQSHIQLSKTFLLPRPHSLKLNAQLSLDQQFLIQPNLHIPLFPH